MAVPNIFGTATAAIPLSQLDTNFATAITLGNTAVYLGNTTTSFGNVTLTNVTISSGNVTVTGANVSGTANVSTLIVTGNQTSLGNVAITGNISANIATFSAGSNTAPSITTTGDTNTGIFFPAADTIAFAEGGVESARIDSSGNFTLNGTAGFNVLGFEPATAIGSGGVNFISAINTTNLAFRTSGTERARIDSSGNLGIGTSSPAARIDAFRSTVGTYFLGGGGDNVARQLAIKSSTTTNSGDTHTFDAQSGTGILAFATTGTEQARIDSSGNLLVGTTTASGKIALEYDGGSVVGENINDSANTNNSTLMQFTIQGTQAGTIKRVGTTSAVVYNTTSDYRLKTVVGTVTGQGDRIDALKPIEYTWNTDGSRTCGFLAHEFQEVYASSVSGDKDAVDANGNPVYQAMQASTSEVIADLVAEIQSLRQRLAAAGI